MVAAAIVLPANPFRSSRLVRVIPSPCSIGTRFGQHLSKSAESSGQIGSSAVLQGETHADPTDPREDKVNPEDDTEYEEA